MKRISSQPHTLVKAIRQFFPGQFFSHIKTSKRTTLWLPQRIVFIALLMMWDAEKALGDRFAAIMANPNQKHELFRFDGCPGSKLRVLVVDDDEDTTKMLAAMLRLVGHDVQTVLNGLDALVAVQANQPDVIFLDIAMPGMSGHEVGKQIVEQANWKRPLLVALTGHGESEDLTRSREAGIDLHLVKPADPDKLMALLARFRETIMTG